jgi:uncharacterized cupin superfamily protein
MTMSPALLLNLTSTGLPFAKALLDLPLRDKIPGIFREDILMPPSTLVLPALDPVAVKPSEGSTYPVPLKSAVAGRAKRRLGDALGLKGFGVNLTTIRPGSRSALRHWHTREDEFIYMVSGELVLVTDGGEQVLTPGMCAGFPAGKADGHQLVNRSTRDAVYLEVGDRDPQDDVNYPDDDLIALGTPQGRRLTRKDGNPY